MQIAQRSTALGKYRYGFQGQEKDNEIKGKDATSLNYTFRMHDPRVGRFFAVDPLARKYPFNSTYAFAENRVLQFNELEGLEVGVDLIKAKAGLYGKAIKIFAIGAEEIMRDVASGAVTVSTCVAIPVVNQFNILRTEGVHGGGALQSKNYLCTPGTRKLDENWNLVNMGINDEGNKEAFKATITTMATILPVEEVMVPIISKVGYVARRIKGFKVFSSGTLAAKRELNGFFATVNETMSEAAKEYQSFVKGRAWNESYILGGTKFDGYIDGILIDAKSGYLNFVNNKSDKFNLWFKGKAELINQARRQLGAVDGNPIRWVFEDEKVMNATKELFEEEGITGIELMHLPKS